MYFPAGPTFQLLFTHGDTQIGTKNFFDFTWNRNMVFSLVEK